jgi:hypothetical protein
MLRTVAFRPATPTIVRFRLHTALLAAFRPITVARQPGLESGAGSHDADPTLIDVF